MKLVITTADVETIVTGSLDFPMSTRARSIADQHLSRVITAESARGGRVRRWSFLNSTRAVLIGGVAAALLAGSVAASGGLFDTLITGSPVLEDVWLNGHDIDASVTDSGYTIVLEKAAVDSERVWVALTLVESPAGADLGQLQVTDANGVVLTGGTGAGTGAVAGQSAMIFGFSIPEGTTLQGPYTLEVTSVTAGDAPVAGDWTFTFDLPASE